jgi:2-polyprenyl-3-methyl-5-hydroxy-6-metoxy-1,4-benzoquinol methylase
VSFEIFRTDRCYVCHGEHIRIVKDHEEFIYLICDDCLAKRIHPKHLISSKQLYDSRYFDGTLFHETSGRIGYHESYAASTSHRTKFYSNYIKKISSLYDSDKLERLKILDFGCGYGIFLRTLINQISSKIDVRGIEVDPAVCAVAASHLGNASVYCVDLKENAESVPHNYFDVITMLDVLEHLDDPGIYLQHLAECAKTSGYLFLSTPNIESLNAKLYGDRWVLHGAPYHAYYFGPKSIQILLQQSGWKVVNLYTERTIFHNERLVMETWRGRIFRALFQNRFWDMFTNHIIHIGSVMIVIAQKC